MDSFFPAGNDRPTIGMQFSILKELIDQLNISVNDYDNFTPNLIDAEEEKETLAKLSSEINHINAILQLEEQVFETVENNNDIQAPFLNDIEVLSETLNFVSPDLDNKRKWNPDSIILPIEEKNNLIEDELNLKLDPEISYFQDELYANLATERQIHDIVIPLINWRLENSGVIDKKNQTITYKGEEYLAIVKTLKEEQLLKLNSVFLNEENGAEIILARKNNKSQQYDIIINNLTKNEFERFKNLFAENFQSNLVDSRNGSELEQLKPDINSEID